MGASGYSHAADVLKTALGHDDLVAHSRLRASVGGALGDRLEAACAEPAFPRALHGARGTASHHLGQCREKKTACLAPDCAAAAYTCPSGIVLALSFATSSGWRLKEAKPAPSGRHWREVASK